jgi:hypothetical protein
MQRLTFDGGIVSDTAVPKGNIAAVLPELAAIEDCVWWSFNSGMLGSACGDNSAQGWFLSLTPLFGPAVDPRGARVLVSSVAGEVWSVALQGK